MPICVAPGRFSIDLENDQKNVLFGPQGTFLTKIKNRWNHCIYKVWAIFRIKKHTFSDNRKTQFRRPPNPPNAFIYSTWWLFDVFENGRFGSEKAFEERPPWTPKKHTPKSTPKIKKRSSAYIQSVWALPNVIENRISKIRTGRNLSKIMIFKKGPKCDFGTLQTEVAQALRFSVFRQLSGQAGGPIGARNPIGSGGLAGRPKISNAKYASE